MRTVLWIGLVLLIIIIAAGGAFYLFRDGLLKTAIERLGSDATGAPVTMAGLSTDLGAGRVSVDTLAIGNPQGFSADRSAFRFGQILMVINPEQAMRGTITVSSVVVSDPAIVLETGSGTATNIQTIRSNLERYAQRSGGGGGGAGDAGSDGGNRFRIEEMRIGETAVTVFGPAGTTTSLTVPAFTLNDLGGESGATGPQIANRVVGALITRTLARTGTGRLDSLRDRIEGALPGGLTGSADERR